MIATPGLQKKDNWTDEKP